MSPPNIQEQPDYYASGIVHNAAGKRIRIYRTQAKPEGNVFCEECSWVYNKNHDPRYAMVRPSPILAVMDLVGEEFKNEPGTLYTRYTRLYRCSLCQAASEWEWAEFSDAYHVIRASTTGI